MKEILLNIANLEVEVPTKKILKGINLTINKGEIHVIMGPNGNGKSTLASSIMGDPKFTITKGKISFLNEDLLKMEVDERARRGLYLAMQYPSELSGVTNVEFIRAAINARREDPINIFEFYKTFNKISTDLKMPEDYSKRFVNVGFSGGEKKRNEIFQMLLLKPKLIMLDEIDSGLDMDAIKIVGENVMNYYKDDNEEVSILVITHYPRLLEYIKPDFVHIMKDGVIVKSGDISLVEELEKTGYDEV